MEDEERSPLVERAQVLVAPITAALASAALGMAAGGPLGASAGAFIGAAAGPVFDLIAEQDQRAAQRPVRVVVDAAALAQVTLEELAAWASAEEHPEHLDLLLAAVEAAWRSRGEQHLRALAHVLADGASDDARVDEEAVTARAIGALTPPHVQVLELITTDGRVRQPPGGELQWGWAADTLGHRLPHLGLSVDALLSTLLAQGCAEVHYFGAGPGGRGAYVATPFGQLCAWRLQPPESRGTRPTSPW